MPWGTSFPKVLDIIYFVVKLSGDSGLILSRWRQSAKEGDKTESLDGHWEVLKEKCCLPSVSSDGRHSAANLVDELVDIVIIIIKYIIIVNVWILIKLC